MMSSKAMSLFVAAAVAMNGVVGIEQGYGGGVWTPIPTTEDSGDSPNQSEIPTATTSAPAVTTAPPTSTEGSHAEQSGSEEESTSSDYDDSTSTSYGGSLIWDGSQITGGSGSLPIGKPGSDDGSIDSPPILSSVDGSAGSVGIPSSGDGSIAYPPTSSGEGSDGIPPGKGGLTPSSNTGSDRDHSTGDDASDVDSSGDDGYPSTGGCKVRRRFRQ